MVDTIDLAEPGMFAAADKTVINWKGENYYQACGAFVSRITATGGETTCVKRKNHPSKDHEDFEGRTKDEHDFGFQNMELEEAVFIALGAASMCWDNAGAAGVFNSSRAKVIGDQLMTRIRSAGPIYG